MEVNYRDLWNIWLPRRESQCQHHLALVGGGMRAKIRPQMEYKVERVRAIPRTKMIRLDKVMEDTAMVVNMVLSVGCWMLGAGCWGGGAIWKAVPWRPARRNNRSVSLEMGAGVGALRGKVYKEPDAHARHKQVHVTLWWRMLTQKARKNDKALGWLARLTLKLLDNYSVLFLYSYYYYRFKVQSRQLFLKSKDGSVVVQTHGDRVTSPSNPGLSAGLCWYPRSSAAVRGNGNIGPTGLSAKHWELCEAAKSQEVKENRFNWSIIFPHMYLYWMWPKYPRVYFLVVCWFLIRKNQFKVKCVLFGEFEEEIKCLHFRLHRPSFSLSLLSSPVNYSGVYTQTWIPRLHLVLRLFIWRRELSP